MQNKIAQNENTCWMKSHAEIFEHWPDSETRRARIIAHHYLSFENFLNWKLIQVEYYMNLNKKNRDSWMVLHEFWGNILNQASKPLKLLVESGMWMKMKWYQTKFMYFKGGDFSLAQKWMFISH